jgi:hydrogenase/urease accessory protein HupE
MNRILPVLIATLAVCTAPVVALAHDAPHERLDLAHGLRHLVTQPDHLLELAVLLALLFAGWRVYRSRTAK